MSKKEFIKALLSQERESSSMVHLLAGDTERLSMSLVDLLQLNESRLSKEALMVVEILENDDGFGCKKEYQEFKWMILGYINLQDAFPTVLYNDVDEKIIFARNYFYYEALSILREFIYCGLNNMTTSARHLVRTFVEFNLRQVYFFERCKREQSYAAMRQYLAKGIVPSNQFMVNYIFPNTAFFKPIKKSIQMILKGLSQSSSHAFDPVHSVLANGKLRHEYSIDSLLFWLTMYSSFMAVLWPYYFAFPTLLKPRDVIRKFGYNYIPGLFITEEQHVAIKKTFKDGDMSLFTEAEPIKSELQSLDEVYDSFPNLSDDEIKSTWTEEGPRPDRHLIGYAQLVAQMRVTSEMLANKFTVDNTEDLTKNVKTDLGLLTRYSFWRDNYKTM